MNKVIQSGRLVKDAEVREIKSGGGEARALIKFTIAVKKNGPAKEGEPDAYFRNVVAFAKPDSKLPNFLKKGAMVVVDGEWTSRKYEDKYYEEINTTTGRIEIAQFADREPASVPASSIPVHQIEADDLPF